MGFKLPGKSLTSGTSAHRSALKMKEASMAKAMAPNKAMESPSKASEFGAAYRKNRDAGKKYFTYKGKEYTTESRSEKAKREKSGKTYAELNPRKSMTRTLTTKKDDPLTKEIKDTSDVKKAEGPREGTKKEKVQVAKKNVKNVRKQAKVKTLKAKQELAETKGRSKKAERLGRKIERKETGKTRREQRLERKLAKAKSKRTPATAMTPNKAMSPNKEMKAKAAPKFNAKLRKAKAEGKLNDEFASVVKMKEDSKRTKRLIRKEANETAKIVDGTKTSARKVNRLVDKIKVSKAKDNVKNVKRDIRKEKRDDRKSAKKSIAAG